MSTPEGRKRDAFGGRGLPQGSVENDPMGTVRRSPDGTLLGIMWPSRSDDPRPWHVIDRHGSVGYEQSTRVGHWPIVGAVPWSPAAGVPLDGSIPTLPVMTKVFAPQLVRLPPPVQRPAPRVAQAETTGERL